MSNIGSLQVTYRNVADIALAMKKFQEKAMPSMSQYQQILKNINDNSQEGLTNQNIRNYFIDVHSLINGTILTIFDAITSIINLYAYDLEKYDGSKEFIVIQEELEKKYPKYKHISDTFSNNHVIIKSAYDSISEYIDEGLLDVSNITSRLEEMHSFFERMYQEIHDEGSSYGAKLIEINDLLHKLQSIIDKAKKIEITSYDISKLAEIPHVSDLTNGVVALGDFLKANTKELAQAAYSLESYQRLKDAEAKRKSLILDIVIAVAGAVASVTAVILTGGAAVFVLVPAIAVTTAVDVGFKVSDAVENESVIHKSRENDMSRGYNPIRETLFNGNQESYDQAKRCASTISQVTQFAAGFAGGVGLVGGLKTATTAAQKGMVFLKAGGRVFVKVGKEIGEGYIEDTVIPGIASATSEFILMQNGYTRNQAKAIIGDKVEVSMKLLGLGGSVRGVVGGVHEYKTARDEFGVTLPGKNRKRKSVNDFELERKRKCDITNIKDIKNRLLDSKNESNQKNKVNKAKKDVDKKHNKGNVQHRHLEVTNNRTPGIDTNTKHKNDIKHDQQQDVENIINNDIENIGIDDQASIIVGKYLHDNNIDYSESDTISKYFKSFDLNKYKGTDHKIYSNGEHIYRKKHNRKALKPNAAYCTGLYKNQFYLTDGMGRIVDTIEIGTRNKYTDKNLDEKFKDRENHYRNPEGKIKGVDDAGHLNADKNGGSSDVDNIVSQNSTLNKKEYKNMEKCINKLIDKGHVVNKRISVEYEDANMRPGKFNIELNVDDKVYYFSFLNYE